MTQNARINLIIGFALAMAFFALLAADLRADESPEPYPTQMATNWSATPTRQPVRPYYVKVYLPMIGGDE